MKRLSLFLAFWLLTNPGAARAQTETQTFDTEQSAFLDGWTGFGNRINNFDFGFSATNQGQGASGPGELGGTIARSQPSAYYADLSLGGTGDLSMDLNATGRLKFQDIGFDGEFFFGWFDSAMAETDAADNLDFLGFTFREPNNGLWRLFASIDDEFATEDHGVLGNQLDLDDDTAFDFEIDWDADGGVAAGDGKLTVTLTEVGGPGSFVSEAEGFDELSFDAFGLLSNNQSGNPGQIASFWMDELEYTVLGDPVQAGDLNADGVVDEQDFFVLSDHLAAHLDGPVTRSQGDMDNDGDIDLADFGLFKELFPAAVGQAQGIPEPASLALAVCALPVLVLPYLRRKRGC